jgi:hypothetical protein
MIILFRWSVEIDERATLTATDQACADERFSFLNLFPCSFSLRSHPTNFLLKQSALCGKVIKNKIICHEKFRLLFSFSDQIVHLIRLDNSKYNIFMNS